MAVPIPQAKSGSRSGERSPRTRSAILASMSARAELVPKHEMAQLGQGWELGLQPRWCREMGGTREDRPWARASGLAGLPGTHMSSSQAFTRRRPLASGKIK